MLSVMATLSGIKKRIELDRLPAQCPHCGTSTAARRMAEPLTVRDRTEPRYAIYLTLCCSARACGLPYFAIYSNVKTVGYHLAGTIPSAPPAIRQDPVIARISPDFYPILQQAAAADGHDLTLIAGAGYRKAIEYLVKDYVVRDLRTRKRDELAKHDTTAAQTTDSEIEAILAKQLGQIITMIPSDDLRAVAKRATWLGNDETHYTRKWVTEDLESLKDVLGLLTSHIVNKGKLALLLERMPEP
jgi:hypothetical protein